MKTDACLKFRSRPLREIPANDVFDLRVLVSRVPFILKTNALIRSRIAARFVVCTCARIRIHVHVHARLPLTSQHHSRDTHTNSLLMSVIYYHRLFIFLAPLSPPSFISVPPSASLSSPSSNRWQPPRLRYGKARGCD